MVWYLAKKGEAGVRANHASVADRGVPSHVDAHLVPSRYVPRRRDPSAKSIKAGGGRFDAFGILVCVCLCVALTAGGSSSAPMSAGLVQACSVPILTIGIWRLFHGSASAGMFWLLMIMVATTGVVLVQMAPLPPEVWAVLPGRQMVAAGYLAAGIPLPWLPISVKPWATESAALGLIPPTAMICAVATLQEPARRALVLTMITVAILSIGLGLMQIIGGADSPLRIYEFTNRDSAVGFFANRNHQAAFLAASIPLAAIFMTPVEGKRDRQGFFWMAAAGGFILLAGVGAAITGSRAGALLVVFGFLGALAMSVRRGRWRWASGAVFVATAALAVGLMGLSGNSLLVDRFHTNFGDDGRLTINPIVARAAAAFAPLGSGVGSFPEVYQMFERPETLGPAYINHAHNEYLEVWLECGWAGAALIGAFMVWWGVASLAALRARSPGAAALQTAGALIVGMLLLHSIVDYPLRTSALATVFGLACGLMLPPTSGSRPGSSITSVQILSRQSMVERSQRRW